MKFRSLILTLICLSCSGWTQAKPISKAEGEAFFKQYIALTSAFDPAFTDLYAPSANIIGMKHTDNGEMEKQQVTGAQWKQLVAFNLSKAKKRNDQSTFNNVRYEVIGERLRIRANRYSLLKCYTDKNYYMVIGRQGKGPLLIEEESFEMHLPNNCKQ
ncbi:MAG TPA: hypothetical protein VL381_03180, partial [Rhodocyclaceae bacterium]|jgi:hypothetical protein|nr:hypothetical protein [Rhodocyclaceae bacterium]